jgi:hypothetical protein
VAFDLLCTLDLLESGIDEQRHTQWQECIRPLIRYLVKADETHAVISNHLATAVAALARWHRCTGETAAEDKARVLLDRILAHQSTEGWFREYEGADPGYQSLCTYYLADLHFIRPDWNLQVSLRRSLEFLWHFAHPDGSFGGLYSSRCTRFYYPAGILALADVIPEASALAEYMTDAISKQHTVTLSAMDEPNLIPMFNAYAWAAVLERDRVRIHQGTVPAVSSASFRRWFPDAGILIDRGPSHYSLIGTHKGGVVYHFVDNKQPMIDAGVVVEDLRGHLGSSQSFNTNNRVIHSEDHVEITAQITAMPKQLPGPFQFLIIRMLSLMLFRSGPIREWIKRRLVELLITKKNVWPVKTHRTISLGRELDIYDKYDNAPGYNLKPSMKVFVPIHMASQGYWQLQDEFKNEH